jgi:hypothetical protein
MRRDSDMNARDAGRRLLVGCVTGALLTGCGAGASTTSHPAAPTPTSVTHKSVTLVTGTHQCPGVSWDWTTDPDGTLHLRDLSIECTDKTDDPRVSGSHKASANMDVWGTLANGAGVQWASVRLENAGGAWEGRQLGVASLPGRGDIMEFWYRGTGGYEGLSYFALVTGSEPWKIQGQIFPGDPPAPYVEGTAITRLQADGPVAVDAAAVVTGTAVCPGLDFTFTTDAEGAQHVRDDYHADRCTVTADDPRVSGHRTSTWNIDLWGSVNAGRWRLVQWGTVRLENAGGAWEGRAAGVASYPERGDIFVNWYEGTGGYEGLGYFELWTGFEPWKIRGEIFPGDPPTP